MIINLCHFCFFCFRNVGAYTNTPKVTVLSYRSLKKVLKTVPTARYFTNNSIEIRQIVRFRRNYRKMTRIVYVRITSSFLFFGFEKRYRAHLFADKKFDKMEDAVINNNTALCETEVIISENKKLVFNKYLRRNQFVSRCILKTCPPSKLRQFLGGETFF